MIEHSQGSEELEAIVLSVVGPERTIGRATMARLLEVAADAIDKSPSRRNDEPVARARVAIELRELERVDDLARRLAAR
jgi:hypothetical protein